MKKYLLLAVSVLFLLSGCAHALRVVIDSINGGYTAQGRSFILTAGNKNNDANDLQFQEYARYTAKALASAGYTQASDPQQADVEVYLSYGIGEPEKHVYSYYEPVWGQVGSETNTYASSHKTDNGTAYSSTSITEPEYGITGYTQQTAEYTVYNKYIILDAYDLKTQQSDGKLRHLWKTTISSTGRATQLRRIVPIMLAGAAEYIGTNTGQDITVEIAEESDKVKSLKGN